MGASPIALMIGPGVRWLALCARSRTGRAARAERVLDLGLGLWLATALLSAGDGTVRLAVVSGTGAPVSGAIVRAFPALDEFELSAQPLAAVHTDIRGNAELSWRYSAPVSLLVSAPGFRSVALPEPAREARVALENGRDVSYEVRSSGARGRWRISWSAAPGVRFAVLSDERGSGVLPGMPLGATEVTIVSAGGRAERGRAALKLGANVTKVAFDLPPSGAIEGRLLDPDGAPLPGELVLMERELSRDASYTTRETRTSDTGHFSFPGLSAGHYTLECAAQGLMAEPVSVQLEEGQRLRLPPIRLRAGSTVVVRFENAATAEPIRNPKVVRESADPKGFSLRDVLRPSTPYIGDAKGDLKIVGLGAGTLALALDSPPFARTRLPVVELGDTPSTIDLGTISVGEGATLALTVVDRADAPVVSMPVQLDRGPALSPLQPAEASTDSEGKCRFARLGRGRYRLKLGGDNRPGGSATLLEEWFSVHDDAQTLTRRLVVGGTRLNVVVRREDGPVAGRWVTLENEASVAGPAFDVPIRIAGAAGQATRLIGAPPRGSSAAPTDASGRVTLTDVQPGSKRLVVEISEGAWSCPIEAHDQDQTVSILIPRASASLRAVDEGDSLPVPNARAAWTSAGGVRAEGFSRDGTVLLDGIPDGPGRLDVTAAGYEGQTLELAESREIPDEVGLRRTGDTLITCRVVDEVGIPIAEAVVDLVRTYPRLARRIAMTDLAGEATIAGIEPGPVRFVVRRRGYAPSAPRSLEVRPGSNDIGTLALSRGYRINVDTPTEEDAAPARVRLRVFDESGTDLGQELDLDSQLTFSRGASVSLGPLGPGRYRLELLDKTSTRTERVDIVDSDVAVDFE